MKACTTTAVPSKAKELVFTHSPWLRMGAWGNELALAP